MSEENQKTKSSGKDRSVAYPGASLGEAIEFTTKLKEALGRGPYSRDEAARALGHSNLTGPAARKVAALVHYGLLERNGNTYSQSQLSQDILKPLSDASKLIAIKKAATKPKLFQKLCQKFGGQALPSMLQNILIREGVSEGAANDVVRIFTETMKFSDLLVNGVLVKSSVDEEGTDSVEEIQTSRPISDSSIQGNMPVSSAAKIMKNGDDFIFEFTGGIRLSIPRTKKTSEAIVDGALRDVKNALAIFAANNMQDEVLDEDVEIE